MDRVLVILFLVIVAVGSTVGLYKYFDEHKVSIQEDIEKALDDFSNTQG